MIFFPDTNFFLHFKDPSEIPWATVTSDDHIQLILLCHKFFRSKICWQHGQRGSVREIARAMAMRTEVIEFGT